MSDTLLNAASVRLYSKISHIYCWINQIQSLDFTGLRKLSRIPYRKQENSARNSWGMIKVYPNWFTNKTAAFSKDNQDECPLKRLQPGQNKRYVPGMWCGPQWPWGFLHLIALPEVPTSTHDNAHCDCSYGQGRQKCAGCEPWSNYWICQARKLTFWGKISLP